MSKVAAVRTRTISCPDEWDSCHGVKFLQAWLEVACSGHAHESLSLPKTKRTFKSNDANPARGLQHSYSPSSRMSHFASTQTTLQQLNLRLLFFLPITRE